jgi:hypothetical protein
MLAIVTLTACDETAPEVPPSIRITQPDDSARITGDVLRILTETTSSCGCNARVEFYIDSRHTYTSYQPFYYFDWDIRGLEGEHVIRTRFVVRDTDEANDSIRVFLQR